MEDESQPLSSTRRTITLLGFVLGFFVDMSLIVVAVIFEWSLVLLLILAVFPVAYYALLRWWDIDERTQLAYNNAARDSILIFLATLFLVSTVLLVYNMVNDNVYWRELSVLMITGFFLLFLQGITAVAYETKYR